MTTFKSVGTQNNYISAAQLADTEVEGTYLGIVEGKFGPNYKIETKNGLVIVNGSGSLNAQFPKVPEGSLVRLEYKGLKKLGGGKTCHDIDVQIGS